jgi:hypothetical protein
MNLLIKMQEIRQYSSGQPIRHAGNCGVILYRHRWNPLKVRVRMCDGIVKDADIRNLEMTDGCPFYQKGEAFQECKGCGTGIPCEEPCGTIKRN